MCSHYQALKEQDKYFRYFGVEPPSDQGKHDLWPGYLGAFIRRHPNSDVGDEAVPPREALTGLFGLVPHWSQDTKIARHTFNARSETVAEKPSFREAWKRAQHCIIPAEAIFEPDWRSGKSVATGIVRADGEPLGIAGLWSSWKSPKGDVVHSYTMLTVNADAHPLMRMFHKPTDEKRMVVILPTDRYQDWLQAPAEHSMEFIRPFPADALQAVVPVSPIEAKLLGQDKETRDKINAQLHGDGLSATVWDNDTKDVARLQANLIQKGSTHKFNPKPSKDTVNLVAIDVTELQLGTVDVCDCLLAAGGNSLAARHCDSACLREAVVGVFEDIAPDNLKEPQRLWLGTIQNLKGDVPHPRTYLHGALFLFREPQERAALSYELRCTLVWNQSLIAPDIAKKICSALYSVIPQLK